MPFLAWSSLCSLALHDLGGERLTCVGVLDIVAVIPYQMPAEATDEQRQQFADVKYAMPPFFVCSSWFKAEEDTGSEYVQRISIVATDGKETPLPDVTAFRIGPNVHRIVQLVPGIGLRSEGPHQIRIYCKPAEGEEWALHDSITFIAIPVPAPEVGNATQQAAEPKQRRSPRRKK